ncbi:hypothetical protein JRQ81_018647, partial [Phrynocephalus forsythii]
MKTGMGWDGMDGITTVLMSIAEGCSHTGPLGRPREDWFSLQVFTVSPLTGMKIRFSLRKPFVQANGKEVEADLSPGVCLRRVIQNVKTAGGVSDQENAGARLATEEDTVIKSLHPQQLRNVTLGFLSCEGGCQNGGECISVGGVVKCLCASGWTGSRCQEAICSQGCRNGGGCVAPGICSCATGWVGGACHL